MAQQVVGTHSVVIAGDPANNNPTCEVDFLDGGVYTYPNVPNEPRIYGAITVYGKVVIRGTANVSMRFDGQANFNDTIGAGNVEIDAPAQGGGGGIVFGAVGTVTMAPGDTHDMIIASSDISTPFGYSRDASFPASADVGFDVQDYATDPTHEGLQVVKT